MVMRSGTASRATALLVVAGVVVIDQLSKVAAAHGATGTIVPEHNPAYAFGIVSGSPAELVIGAVVVLGAFLVVADALSSRFGISAFLPALIAGGTIGNTLDRVRLGAVRDFIAMPWAIINLADVAVAVGIVGLVIALAARAPRSRTELATVTR
jgi:signal peptidase II